MDNDVKEFLTAIAQWNSGTDDLDNQPFGESDVVKTHEPRSAFVGDQGLTKIDELYFRPEFQIGKGLRRGDLFVMDKGGFRLVATSAEGTIR